MDWRNLNLEFSDVAICLKSLGRDPSCTPATMAHFLDQTPTGELICLARNSLYPALVLLFTLGLVTMLFLWSCRPIRDPTRTTSSVIIPSKKLVDVIGNAIKEEMNNNMKMVEEAIQLNFQTAANSVVMAVTPETYVFLITESGKKLHHSDHSAKCQYVNYATAVEIQVSKEFFRWIAKTHAKEIFCSTCCPVDTD